MIAALWFTSQFESIWRDSPFTDFDAMVRGAQAVAAGQSPYDVPHLAETPFGAYYKFPPLFASLLAPFTVLPEDTLVRYWLLVNLGFYLAAFLLLVRTESIGSNSPQFYLLAIGFLIFQPTLDTLFGGELEIVLLLSFTVAYWALRQAPARSVYFGASIALAGLIKLYPLVFVPYLIVRRNWRPLLWIGIWLGILTLASVAISGWKLQNEFLYDVLPSQPGGTAWLENQSFFGFISRFLVDGATVDQARATVLPIATLLSNLAAIVCFVLSMLVLRRTSEAKYAFVILLPLMLLALPAAWIHYETILLLPLGILLMDFSRKSLSLGLLPLALCFGLLAYGNEDTVLAHGMGLVPSYKFCGILLLWGVGTVLAWQASAVPSPAASGVPARRRGFSLPHLW